MIGIVLIALPLLAFAVFLFWMNTPATTEIGTCKRTIGADCTDIKPAFVEKQTTMTLPTGTVIEDSTYQGLQDSQFKATLYIPVDGVTAWEQSLQQYQPAEPCGTDVCGKGTAKDPDRSYTRTNNPDGSITVKVVVLDG